MTPLIAWRPGIGSGDGLLANGTKLLLYTIVTYFIGE